MTETHINISSLKISSRKFSIGNNEWSAERETADIRESRDKDLCSDDVTRTCSQQWVRPPPTLTPPRHYSIPQAWNLFLRSDVAICLPVLLSISQLLVILWSKCLSREVCGHIKQLRSWVSFWLAFYYK